jgi:hypothetical protein
MVEQGVYGFNTPKGGAQVEVQPQGHGSVTVWTPDTGTFRFDVIQASPDELRRIASKLNGLAEVMLGEE